MSKAKVYLTDHSKVRFGERTDYADQVRPELASKAFSNGYTFSSFKSPVSDFLKSISYNDGRYVAKIYENYVYIFNNCNGHRLLTVYAVPEEYLPLEQYLIQNEDLGRCMIVLVNKETGEKKYWHEFGGLTDDLAEALEFTNQRKANNYLNNNHEIEQYTDIYDIVLI